MKLTTKSGKQIHPIGIGTWGMGGAWEVDHDHDQEAIDAIRFSIAHGQNHIDTAQMYGQGHTDELVGKAIKGFKREDLFIADKLWKTHVGTGKVREAVEEMLAKHNADYLDVLYIHKAWDDAPWQEALPQIDELIDEGLVRYFGVSNFTIDQLKETAKISKHPITLNQILYNVLIRDEYSSTIKDFCSSNNIQMVAYRPLERGAVLDNKVVQSVAKSHGCTPGQVALAWLLHQDFYPIPKTKDQARIVENIESTHITLTKDDLEKLNDSIGSS